MLEGRAGDLARLGALIDRARAGDGAAIWLVGDAGIGKSALLDALVAQLPPDVQVMRIVGREPEAGLAWGALAALLTPLVVAGHADHLPEAQHTAILAALALEVPDGALEPYAVVAGAQAMLRRAAATRALVLVVDDVHWLDESTHLALAFLAARERDGRVVIVAAGRQTPERQPPVPPVELGPIDGPAADSLLTHLGVSAATVRHRIVEEFGGTPLLLLAAGDGLDAAQRSGQVPLPEVLPVPHSVMRLAEERLQTVPETTRTALLVATTASGAVDVVAGALDELGTDVAELEPAERAGLITIADGEIQFDHPTLRSAAYHSASADQRRAAHRAVATASSDPSARAWHGGLGTLGVDDEVADALERSSRSLIQRGAALEAARHLELSARLTSRDGPHAGRLRQAAEILAEHGHDDAAEALLGRADRGADDPVEAVRRQRIRLRMALRAGAVDEPVAALRALADEVGDGDPGLAAELLLDVAAPLVRMVRATDLRDVAERALALATAAGDERLARRADVAAGIGRISVGDGEGYAALERYTEVLEIEGAIGAGEFLAEVVAPCLAYFKRSDDARALFDLLERDLRATSAIPVLVPVLAAQAIAIAGSSVARASDIAEEAVDLAAAMGRPSLAIVARQTMSMATAAIGDRPRCMEAYTSLLDSEEPSVRQTGLAARAFLHIGHGELDEAIATYEQLADDVGIGQAILRWEAEWCEALIRVRRPDDAARVLDTGLENNLALLSGGTFARAQALLADDLDAAESHFLSSISWYQLVGNQVGEGRTELAWGERLRRARRRGAARGHLDRALTLLQGVGATVWAERAQREVEAAGGVVTDAVEGMDALTTQELAIARHAATGATNREIGEQVFLSPRTVETHLGSVFRKLGVANRRQLVALALEEPRLRP